MLFLCPNIDPCKHLHPVSLTPILSNVVEEYVVEASMKATALKGTDPQQLGTVPTSSTMHVLISMIHLFLQGTDGNGETMRVMLLDF